MDRRTFLTMSGIGVAGLVLPFGRVIAAEALLVPIDVAKKKALADAALAGRHRGRRHLLRRAHRPLPATSS